MDLASFRRLATRGNLVPIARRLMSDLLTPVAAYRRIVAPDERTAPSFLLESVENASSVGRFSFLGAAPSIEVLAREHEVTVIDHDAGTRRTSREDDPLAVMQRLSAQWRAARPATPPAALPAAGFLGGWVGYAGYDTVRYLESAKLPFSQAPDDDRKLPDLHFGLYRRVAIFDHVERILHAVCWVSTADSGGADAAWRAGELELDRFVESLSTPGPPLAAGVIDINLAALPATPLSGSFDRADYERAVERCRAYIGAGDAFQVVLSQRFERVTEADPFDVYRALRIVNPSPYMIYLQAAGSILVGASPEILCRVEGDLVTSRPLAGTRRRGDTPAADRALEAELRLDAKERAEHVMLVDLARNDLGRVCRPGTIELPRLLEVERYSHVMHLSSTVRGRLRDGADCWGALRATLPVGTVSGAPKVRAMQIIDELEPVRRGPYAGGIGVVGFGGDMDVAIALRTMVVPTAHWKGGPWTVHLQAGAGIVADSVPARESDETVSKAAALGRAIDLAERVFPAARAGARGSPRGRGRA